MKLQLEKNIDPSIFRAYDIRGIVEKSLSPKVVYTLGMAIGSEALDRGEKTIIVGRDGRLSGPELSKALITGLLATGCNVIDVGLVPTPVLYFATNHLKARSGVMLTGSHNPADYNGLKIVLGGTTLAEEDIQKLSQRITQEKFHQGSGHLTEQPIIPAYIARIVQDVHLKKPLKVVIDCGNGVAGCVAPQLMRELGCEVIELFCDIDGLFPNHHPDPSVTENLKDLIREVHAHKADLGLAFDGDADRLGVVTNTGEVIWPDRQLMLFAVDLLSRHPGATIIYDVKCTNHLSKVITECGGKPLMWKTGHSLIKTKLKETNALLAGEMSGHIFFKEHWYGFDDAIYAAARLLEIISGKTETIDQIFKSFPDSINTPELKLPISEENKFPIMEKLKKTTHIPEAKVTTIDGLRLDFEYGWGLIRPSNTTPCLVLRFEAIDEMHLKKIQDLFRKQLLAIDKTLQLPF